MRNMWNDPWHDSVYPYVKSMPVSHQWHSRRCRGVLTGLQFLPPHLKKKKNFTTLLLFMPGICLWTKVHILWTPARDKVQGGICLHAGQGPARGNSCVLCTKHGKLKRIIEPCPTQPSAKKSWLRACFAWVASVCLTYVLSAKWKRSSVQNFLKLSPVPAVSAKKKRKTNLPNKFCLHYLLLGKNILCAL